MAETQSPTTSIKLGPGGQVTDPALLKVLEVTPILLPKALLKLSIHFIQFSSNADLGNLLWKQGVAKIITDPRVAPVIKETFDLNSDEYWDQQEDAGYVPDEPGDGTFAVIGPSEPQFVFVWVFGIGLLIQKVLSANGDATFYILNVSPNPEDLPDPGASENPTPTSPK